MLTSERFLENWHAIDGMARIIHDRQLAFVPVPPSLHDLKYRQALAWTSALYILKDFTWIHQSIIAGILSLHILVCKSLPADTFSSPFLICVYFIVVAESEAVENVVV